MKVLTTFVFIITFIVHFVYAQELSPAGGNYLDLSDGVYYFAEDSPSLDALLGDEWTIEGWIYIREFPPIPDRSIPADIMEAGNMSPIFLKPMSYHIYLVSFFEGIPPDQPQKLKLWKVYCWFMRFFAGVEIGTIGRGSNLATNGEGIDPKFFQGPLVELNKWQYFVVQQEQSLLTMYFNGRGKIDNYEKPWKMPDHPRRLYIGGIPAYELHGGEKPPYFPPERVYPFNGATDEIRISNIARYKGGVVIPRERFRNDKHTLALWHFDEPKGSIRYTDSSGNGNTLISSKVFNVNLHDKLLTSWGKIKKIP